MQSRPIRNSPASTLISSACPHIVSVSQKTTLKQHEGPMRSIGISIGSLVVEVADVSGFGGTVWLYISSNLIKWRLCKVERLKWDGG